MDSRKRRLNNSALASIRKPKDELPAKKKLSPGNDWVWNSFWLMYPMDHKMRAAIQTGPQSAQTVNPAVADVLIAYYYDFAPFLLSSEQLVQLFRTHEVFTRNLELIAQNSEFLRQELGVTNAEFMNIATRWDTDRINRFIQYGKDLKIFGLSFAEINEFIALSGYSEALFNQGILFTTLGCSIETAMKMAKREGSAFTMQTLLNHYQELTTTFQLTLDDVVWLSIRPVGVASTIEFIMANKDKLIALGFVGADKFRELFRIKTHTARAKKINEMLNSTLVATPADVNTDIAPPVIAPRRKLPPKTGLTAVDYQSASTTMFKAPVVKPEPVTELDDSEITQRIYDAVMVLRGLSDATHNCGHLAADLLKYFRGHGFPTTPSLTTACTIDDSGVIRRPGKETIQVKKEPNSSDTSTRTIAGTVSASSYSNIGFFQKVGAPLPQYHPQANFVETEDTNDTRLVEQYDVEDQLFINVNEYKKYAAFINDINTRLIALADTRPGKILCGSISFAPTNKDINNPGHVIPFYVANNRIWFVDAQYMVNGRERTEKPVVFHDLSKAYNFSTDSKSTGFSPRVFFLPFDAEMLAPNPAKAAAEVDIDKYFTNLRAPGTP